MHTISLPSIWKNEATRLPLDFPSKMSTMSKIWNNWTHLRVKTRKLMSDERKSCKWKTYCISRSTRRKTQPVRLIRLTTLSIDINILWWQEVTREKSTVRELEREMQIRMPITRRTANLISSRIKNRKIFYDLEMHKLWDRNRRSSKGHTNRRRSLRNNKRIIRRKSSDR